MVYVNFQLQWRNKEKTKGNRAPTWPTKMGTCAISQSVGGGKVSHNERRMEDKMKIPLLLFFFLKFSARDKELERFTGA